MTLKDEIICPTCCRFASSAVSGYHPWAKKKPDPWNRHTDPEECPKCGRSRWFCPSEPDQCSGCEDLFD